MAVTLGGTPIEVSGTFPKVGDTAPDFKLVNKDLADVSLADFAGKKKILNIVPSLDTPVCAISTKKFNDAAVGNTVVLIIAADLPFAMSRFCGAESTNNVVTLSTMRGAEFMKNYGVVIPSGPLAASPRAPWWCSTRPTRCCMRSSCPRSSRSRITRPLWRP